MTDATLSTEELPPDGATTDAADSTEELDDVDAAEDALEEETGSDLQLGGAPLDDAELAAVTAVLGTLAGASGAEHTGAGSTGPTDRTLQRRRRLGLWGRPGPDSWKHAAGLR